MTKPKNRWLLAPIFGAIFFVVLYLIATLFYPGGSQVNVNSVGFSWVNNYWCNLLNEFAINGQVNPAKPIAITALVVICITLALFWFQFPKYVSFRKTTKLTIQLSGIVSMTIALFLFSGINHDLITYLASGFGLIACVGVFAGLYKMKHYKLFIVGCLNIILVILNNYLYFNKELIVYLPVIQKISFATFLVWVCSINFFLYRSAKSVN
jgi:hypothetical protein